MASRLAGRTALVTGAGGGIGGEVARHLLREGARVVATDRDVALVEAWVDDLGMHDSPLVVRRLDVTSAEGWRSAVDLAHERFGGLDVLINVAGILDWGGIEATEPDAWDRVVAVNQTGTWLGMRAALPLLRASGHGSIVNVSSVLGIVGGGGAAAYHATKGAVRLLTKTAAVEYATQGVRVNSLHPGVVATPMIQELLDAEGDQQADIRRTPMRRSATVDEIAPAVVFLASDEASFVTGAELVVDGGLTAH